MKMEFDLRDLNRTALERMVKQLLSSSEAEEKDILKKLNSKNDLADLDEEMHGKSNAPKVTEDDLPYKGEDELPDVPKKEKKRG
jgi:hypothetical protein